jgi:hypothetical protein
VPAPAAPVPHHRSKKTCSKKTCNPVDSDESSEAPRPEPCWRYHSKKTCKAAHPRCDWLRRAGGARNRCYTAAVADPEDSEESSEAPSKAPEPAEPVPSEPEGESSEAPSKAPEPAEPVPSRYYRGGVWYNSETHNEWYNSENPRPGEAAHPHYTAAAADPEDSEESSEEEPEPRAPVSSQPRAPVSSQPPHYTAAAADPEDSEESSEEEPEPRAPVPSQPRAPVPSQPRAPIALSDSPIALSDSPIALSDYQIQPGILPDHHKMSELRALVSRDMAQRILLAIDRDPAPKIREDNFNVVYDIGNRMVLRVSKPLNPTKVRAYERALELAKIMGDAAIGPPILWSSIVHTQGRDPHIMSIQEHGGPSLRDKLLDPDIADRDDLCDIMAKQLLRLMCRVAALGFMDADLRPANIVISGHGSSLRALIIDFDPKLMVRVRDEEAAAATAEMVYFLMSHLEKGHFLVPQERYLGYICLHRAMIRAVPVSRLNTDAWDRVDQSSRVQQIFRHYLPGLRVDWPVQLGLDLVLHEDSEKQRVGSLRFPGGRAPPECGSPPRLQMEVAEAWKLADHAALQADRAASRASRAAAQVRASRSGGGRRAGRRAGPSDPRGTDGRRVGSTQRARARLARPQ